MAMDPKAASRLLRKLRKSLKSGSEPTDPEEIHRMRTRTRTLEAMLRALMLDRERLGRGLLRAMGPLRKRAGRVRDMDVLLELTAKLKADGEGECRVRLLEHLVERRQTGLATLHDEIAARRGKARRRLRRCGRKIGKMLTIPQRDGEGNEVQAGARAVALELAEELRGWSRITVGNVHEFRIRAKQLRYILQMIEEEESELTRALGRVKDAVGMWHDWSELEAIAGELLKEKDCGLLREIRQGVAAKLKEALEETNRMRRQHLQGRTVQIR